MQVIQVNPDSSSTIQDTELIQVLLVMQVIISVSHICDTDEADHSYNFNYAGQPCHAH